MCFPIIWRVRRAVQEQRATGQARKDGHVPTVNGTGQKFEDDATGEGTGSMFWTLVPLKLPNAAARKVGREEVPETPAEGYRQVEAAPVVEGARGKALIVEDSAPIRKMLKRILERAGFSVDEAGNGEQGLDKLTRTSYDVCIMDFIMPIMDGVTCTRN